MDEADTLSDAGDLLCEQGQMKLGRALLQHADEHYSRLCRWVSCELVTFATDLLENTEH